MEFSDCVAHFVCRLFDYYLESKNLQLYKLRNISQADFMKNAENARHILRMIKGSLTGHGWLDLCEAWFQLQNLLFISTYVTWRSLASVVEHEDILDCLPFYKMTLSDENVARNVVPNQLLYSQLSTTIEVLDEETEEWHAIKKYCVYTSGSFAVRIRNVYKLNRSLEKQSSLNNRTLLFHGTKRENIVTIMKHGLQLPMYSKRDDFGIGIYFTDYLAKALSFARSNLDATHFVFLCIVALGNSVKCCNDKKPRFENGLPEGFHSAKGEGMWDWNEEDLYVRHDGVIIPGAHQPPLCMRGQVRNVCSDYVIFDSNQVKLGYILEVDVNERRSY